MNKLGLQLFSPFKLETGAFFIATAFCVSLHNQKSMVISVTKATLNALHRTTTAAKQQGKRETAKAGQDEKWSLERTASSTRGSITHLFYPSDSQQNIVSASPTSPDSTGNNSTPVMPSEDTQPVLFLKRKCSALAPLMGNSSSLMPGLDNVNPLVLCSVLLTSNNCCVVTITKE